MATSTDSSAKEHAPPQRPVTNLGWMLSQASYVLKTHMTAALEDVGISPRSFHVLKTAMGGEFTQTELATAVGLDKTTMVVTVDELEAAGLAKRLPSAEDRRARVIAVTKAGERTVERAWKIVEHVQEEVLSALPARERKIFLDSLARLVDECEAATCSQPVRRREPRG